MICVYCLNKKTKTPNSRPHKKHAQVWRRRHCEACGRTFTTYERPSLEDVVVRREERDEHFSIGTLTVSLYRSLAQAHLSGDTSYALAQTVEQRLIQRYDLGTAITPAAIAQEAYLVLKHFDEISALQYGAAHGIVTSIRRRGRPSTTATNGLDDAALS